jgi:hypothetical protein
MKPLIWTALCLFPLVSCRPAPPPAAEETIPWWKGNLHTHSLWSDGDDFPEMSVDWYKSHDYHFLALSDHNILAEGEKTVEVPPEVLEAYRTRFGADWVVVADGAKVKLKTLAEYRSLFEEPGTFLLIQSEEITDRFEEKSIHVNATNLKTLIPPQGGSSVGEVLQRNVDAVLGQRRETGQPMFPHVNHPNFGWSIRVEDLIALRGEKFFEVYNGHPFVNNEGDELRPSTERIWDILLAERLSGGEEVMYGVAVDDAHNYHDIDSEHSNPGRGWVMVRARALTPDALIAAMEQGDFYGSSGVTLEEIVRADASLSLRIAAEEGVEYKTAFIGTRKGYDRSAQLVPASEGGAPAPIRFRYSDEIGRVLAEVEGPSPSYTFQGDELYVRAKVVSTKLKANPYREGEREAAWVQPVVLGR